MCRRLGVSLCGSDKCPVKRGKGRPGQHGHKRRRRPSDYSKQLQEKQKAKHIYGIVERQFRRYFDEARALKGETGKLLLQKLERRLDNVVYRLGFAQSRPHARQLVRHGKIAVNGKTVTIPSFELSTNDEVKFVGGEENLTYRDNLVVPAWLSLDKKKNRGIVKRTPLREDLDQEIDEKLIVEHYSRG
jgi:small subunit ribosomal protein S4